MASDLQHGIFIEKAGNRQRWYRDSSITLPFYDCQCYD